MKGRLALLNLALAALAVLGAWQLRVRWLEARARQAALYHQQAAPPPAPPVAPNPPAQPVTAVQYGDVAQKLLFAKDRNPTVEIEVTPPKPMPPLPIAYGVMAFGDVRSAILSPKSGVPHHAYQPGDMVGEFKLVSVDPDQIVFEWDGQTIVKPLEELLSKDRGGAAAAAQSAGEAPAAPAPPPAVTTTVAAPTQAGPGVEVTSEIRACLPGDTSPVGTVSGGWRKTVIRTPFGTGCRWEPVK